MQHTRKMNILTKIRNWMKKRLYFLYESAHIYAYKYTSTIHLHGMLLKRNINHKHIIQHKYTNKPHKEHNSEWNEENEERNHEKNNEIKKEKSRNENITRNEMNRFAENLNKFFMRFLNLSLWYFFCAFFCFRFQDI